jgi:hypothetical protein
MREELSQIDLSPLAELVRIKHEEEVLAERLVKIEDRAEKVSRTVYERVKRDYETRRAAFEKESRPLKDKARIEYRRLQALRAQVAQAVEAAALDKEKLAACEARLSGEKKALDDVDQTKAKFLEAFRSEEELEAGSPPPPPPPPPARPSAVSSTFVPPPADATVIGGSALEPESPDATVIRTPRPGPESTAAGPEPTRILSRMRLALLDANDAVAKEFPLTPGVAMIGRLTQSEIHLPTPDVSRRHAQIVLGDDGCFVVDMGSENGVTVNGARVQKHKLADGDLVQLGKQRLRFLA